MNRVDLITNTLVRLQLERGPVEHGLESIVVLIADMIDLALSSPEQAPAEPTIVPGHTSSHIGLYGWTESQCLGVGEKPARDGSCPVCYVRFAAPLPPGVRHG